MSDDRQRSTRSTTPAPSGEESSSDFGRFVSSSAGKSFRQLSRERKQARGTRREEPTDTPAQQSDDAAPERPIGRRWRDAAGVQPANAEQLDDGDVATIHDDRTTGGAGVPFVDRLLDENGKPRREAIVAAVALLALIILIIFLATRGGDGNDDDPDVTPTATGVTNVLGEDTGPDQSGTPPATESSNSTPDVETPPTRDVEPTPDEESDDVQVGGDNQRD